MLTCATQDKEDRVKRKNAPLEARVTIAKLMRLYEEHGIVTVLRNGKIVKQTKEKDAMSA